ncbi:hypothetical protein COOONC_06455 [Cooperia oncophora]
MYLESMYIFDHYRVPLSVLITATGLLASIASKVVRIEAIFSTVIDYTDLVPTQGIRTAVLYIICLTAALLSLIPYCPYCYVPKISLQTNVMPAAAIVVVLVELLVICCFYGTQRISSNVTTMTIGKAILEWGMSRCCSAMHGNASNKDDLVQTLFR